MGFICIAIYLSTRSSGHGFVQGPGLCLPLREAHPQVAYLHVGFEIVLASTPEWTERTLMAF